LLDSIDSKMTLGFKKEDDIIYLIGKSTNDINSSEYLHKIVGVELSPAPYFELEEEFQLQQSISQLIQAKLIQSAHDISEGGLIVTLLEAGFVNELGFEVVQSDTAIRSDAFWFGESQSRVVVSVSPENKQAFEAKLAAGQVTFQLVGKVKGKEVKINQENWGMIASWKKTYDEKISSLMK
ncbi:MAG: phosphoribosylformylglycinamidine synthase subunit PurL, partial [Bacteroidota bacterium]